MLGRIAKNVFKSAVNKKYNEARILNAGIIFYSEGKYDLAIERFSKILEADSTSPVYYIYRAQAYRAKGMLQQADQDVKSALLMAIVFLCKPIIKDHGVSGDIAKLKYNEVKEIFPDYDEPLILATAFKNMMPEFDLDKDTLVKDAMVCCEIAPDYDGESKIVLLSALVMGTVHLVVEAGI